MQSGTIWDSPAGPRRGPGPREKWIRVTKRTPPGAARCSGGGSRQGATGKGIQLARRGQSGGGLQVRGAEPRPARGAARKGRVGGAWAKRAASSAPRGLAGLRRYVAGRNETYSSKIQNPDCRSLRVRSAAGERRAAACVAVEGRGGAPAACLEKGGRRKGGAGLKGGAAGSSHLDRKRGPLIKGWINKDGP
ncbi:MAG: hypothetical protein J3K34DRAFT_413131 [Monoraphidium minutum]|nr:MAG: hypothetical protein J3K34DRAFT_413131 [Monoraphidium minutum]